MPLRPRGLWDTEDPILHNRVIKRRLGCQPYAPAVHQQRYQLLVTTNAVHGSLILLIMMLEEILSFETSVLTLATQRNIPEDAILHTNRRETLKCYIALTGWTV
jgi:hypothetical protein